MVTKTQRETREYFSMALVIKTHQNNNKERINIFGERPRPINLFWRETSIIIIILLLKKNFFEEMGTIAPTNPSSLSL
jgi:hypothetical protein